MKTHLWAVSILWFIHASYTHAETPSLADNTISSAAVEMALARLDAQPLDDHWHFTMQVKHDELEQVVRSDPNREPALRRVLRQVDGNEPSAADRENFRATEAKRINEQNTDTQAFSYLVDTSTLNFIGAQNGIAEFAFVPRIEKLEQASESLRGKLKLNVEKGYIAALEVFNVEEFSPAFSVTMEQFRLSFAFAPQAGENVLAAMENQARGKAGFMKEFNSKTTIIFSDYKKISE
ncbi:MAG: hypothetical protein AB8C02_19495 [Halioglobus sp.]